jgi:cobalt/nickel transport system permease protein
MHIAEGVLPARDALFWWVVATPALVWGFRRDAERGGEQEPEQRALEGMAVGLLFAMTSLPIPVPVAGATSHVCATPVLALLLGLRRVVLPTALVLFVQALFFAHGGLTTLGANVITLGVLGPAVAVLVARGLAGLRVPAFVAIVVACFLGNVAVYAGDTLI